jgi:plasmid maintenance system antidote protein VapI
MKRPSHPGRFLRRQVIEALGLSVSAAAAIRRRAAALKVARYVPSARG